jgi:hypothetical protein
MKKLLIIGLVWPEPSTTAAGTRMVQLINAFKSEFDITFACAASKTAMSFNLNSINVASITIKLNHSSFDTFIKELRPDVVLFDRFISEEQYGWRVAENCPNAIKVLDTEDLHFVRKAREISLKKNENYTKHLLNDNTIRELASIFRCDLSLIISKFEYELLINKFKISQEIIIYTPFLEQEVFDFLKYPDFNNRKDFISIGNFNHKPNWQSVLLLKQTIWPKIRNKLPNANLRVYGAYATEKVLQLHNEKEGFLIKGWAENIKDTFTEARVLLAPLQFGAGLKGKIVDSMKFGTPNVTTSIGAEGMNYNEYWNGTIEDSIDDFASEAVELYQNKTKWLKSQQNGIVIFNQLFSKNKFEAELLNKLEFILENIEVHRFNNIVGEILQHHFLKSNMYMSKWIEEKNKN